MTMTAARPLCFDLDGEVVEHDVEVARDAFQGKPESRRRQHGAAEELETAAAQRARKQGESPRRRGYR
jgi:hypothetical protein